MAVWKSLREEGIEGIHLLLDLLHKIFEHDRFKAMETRCDRTNPSRTGLVRDMVTFMVAVWFSVDFGAGLVLGFGLVMC